MFRAFVVLTIFTWKTFSGTCPDQCLSYFDGCNTCDCTNAASPFCTSRVCRETSTDNSYCSKCSSNFVWNDCGSRCDKTCDNPSPICIAECYARCECPSDKPILHNGECITYDDCTRTEILTVCPDDCSTYFDGCNFCECNSDGSMSCTSNTCSEYSEPYCASCQNNLQWATCGSSCTKTCSNTTLQCNDSQCVARCECPPNKPIYHNGVCLESEECFNFQNICPSNCTIYSDGCNDCTCLNGEDACTNRVCITMGTPQCTNCTNNMEWNTCGSTCTKTCQNPNASCDDLCVPKCECPADKPILKNGTCVTYDECDCQCYSIPLPNGQYSEKRTKKCQSLTTEDECTAIKNCLWKCQ